MEIIKKRRIILLLAFLSLFSLSCDRGASNTDPAGSFSKIYDKPEAVNYTAIDVKQTADGSYIILGKTDQHPYLLKVSKQGNFEWDTETDACENYINPISELLILNDEYYFFCNKEPDDEEKFKPLVLLKLSESNNEPFPVDLSPHHTKHKDILADFFVVPLTAKVILAKSILLLAVDSGENNYFVLRIEPDGTVTWLRDFEFQIACANEYPLLDKRYHFIESVEAAGNTDYKFHSYLFKEIGHYPNCFRITSIENLAEGNLSDHYTIIGIPFVAMLWHSIDKGSAARVENNIVTFFLDFRLIMDEEKEKQYIALNNAAPHNELIESEPVFILTMTVSGQEVVFFAGSTKSDEIVLYAYDKSNCSFLGERYFGGTRFYKAAGLIKTDDGGFAILGTTYVADLFDRICLFKLSKAELEDMVRQSQ